MRGPALGIAPLARAFRAREDDPVRALDRALQRADAAAADRALLCRVPGARADAEASRARLAAGAPRSGLEGIPVVVKDCIDMRGLPTSQGTSFLREPAGADAALVTRLREAGAVIFAKANMHEFGLQPTGVNPHLGTPVNAWDPSRIPGGSSSGAALAVATGIAAAAVGTDAGGSVRVPAALQGLVGLKPTYGAIPMQGVAALTRELDHAGPIGWTVEDVARLFEVLAGTSLESAPGGARAALLGDFLDGCEAPVERAVRAACGEVFGALDAVATPMCRWASAVELVIVGGDLAHSIGPLRKAHFRRMGLDTQVLLQLSGGLTADERRRAEGVRRAMRAELDALLERYDVLVGPAVGRLAPPLGAAARATGELDTAGMARLAAVTFPANLTGLPACTVPCVREGLPVGLQIIGRAGGEARVLSVASRVEAAFGPRQPPRWYGEPGAPAAGPRAP